MYSDYMEFTQTLINLKRTTIVRSPFELALICYSRNGILLGMLCLRLTGCDDHVLPRYFCVKTSHSSCAQTLLWSLDYGRRGGVLGATCHAMKSWDSYNEFRLCIVNIVMEFIDVYGERSLTWLLWLCKHDRPNSLLAFVENSWSSRFGSCTCAVRELKVVFGVPTEWNMVWEFPPATVLSFSHITSATTVTCMNIAVVTTLPLWFSW